VTDSNDVSGLKLIGKIQTQVRNNKVSSWKQHYL